MIVNNPLFISIGVACRICLDPAEGQDRLLRRGKGGAFLAARTSFRRKCSGDVFY
jgi:hypothetical protein